MVLTMMRRRRWWRRRLTTAVKIQTRMSTMVTMVTMASILTMLQMVFWVMLHQIIVEMSVKTQTLGLRYILLLLNGRHHTHTRSKKEELITQHLHVEHQVITQV
tara:strand:- start:115 stop:426 length:312 start_codon:yes stop_codon:yes gene_type:complete